jgi:hypothetical protein
MDDDTTRRGRRDDDPGATGPLWPVPDDDLTDPHDDATRRGRRAAEPRGAPDQESTSVLSQAATRARGADPTRVAPDDARGWAAEPMPERPMPRRPRAGRPRRARSGLAWPRIVAPIVLLAAVLTVVTLGVHAGVFRSSKTPAGRPTVAASHTATTTAKSKYMTYRVRSGDTMSGIAAKFNITVGQLMALNPTASSTTIVVGEKLKVPRRK